ncbi:MAG: hypothetical protein KDB60_16020, partial [Propionibacteriaceae bacterium]|nr:hypothetical protein [Propionibacteriaceae bacterium]
VQRHVVEAVALVALVVLHRRGVVGLLHQQRVEVGLARQRAERGTEVHVLEVAVAGDPDDVADARSAQVERGPRTAGLSAREHLDQAPGGSAGRATRFHQFPSPFIGYSCPATQRS